MKLLEKQAKPPPPPLAVWIKTLCKLIKDEQMNSQIQILVDLVTFWWISSLQMELQQSKRWRALTKGLPKYLDII